jgi:hypothetical protein
MKNNRSEHPVKKWALKWIWRTQQIGAISTLVITAVTLTLTVSDKIEWRVSHPYISILLTFSLLATVIIFMGWLWDKKLQMWREQNVVNVERNPYYMFKQSPKEIVSYNLLWFPMLNAQANLCDRLHLHAESKDLRKIIAQYGGWCKEQVASDSILKRQVNELSDYLKSKGE